MVAKNKNTFQFHQKITLYLKIVHHIAFHGLGNIFYHMNSRVKAAAWTLQVFAHMFFWLRESMFDYKNVPYGRSDRKFVSPSRFEHKSCRACIGKKMQNLPRNSARVAGCWFNLMLLPSPRRCGKRPWRKTWHSSVKALCIWNPTIVMFESSRRKDSWYDFSRADTAWTLIKRSRNYKWSIMIINHGTLDRLA